MVQVNTNINEHKAVTDYFSSDFLWHYEDKSACRDKSSLEKSLMKRHLDTCCGKRHYRRCHVKGEGLSAGKGQQETSGDVHGVRSQISYRQGDISSNKHLRPTQTELFLKMMFR